MCLSSLLLPFKFSGHSNLFLSVVCSLLLFRLLNLSVHFVNIFWLGITFLLFIPCFIVSMFMILCLLFCQQSITILLLLLYLMNYLWLRTRGCSAQPPSAIANRSPKLRQVSSYIAACSLN